MRILRPRMRLVLVESRQKRCTFLETVIHELHLEGTVVANQRLEDFLETEKLTDSWDTVSWKALKVGSKAVRNLMERSGQNARFWLFHGKELPVSDPDEWMRLMTLVRREACPARAGWFLSIYGKNRKS